MSKTTFNTDAIAKRVRKAAIEAVDETTEAAAQEASSKHWWHARRGRRGLQGQVRNEAASVKDGKVVGRFGSTMRDTGFHGLILERKRPWLRPVADRVYPTVSGRISKRLR